MTNKNDKNVDHAELGRTPARHEGHGANRAAEVGVAIFQTADTAGVRNRMRVRSPLVDPADYPEQEPRDEQIVRSIRDLIAQDARLEVDAIAVHCAGGEVALEGRATSPRAEQELIARAADLPGVRVVHSTLG